MTRTKFLKGCLLLAVGIIAVRLFFIQIIQHNEWVAKAESQHTLENTIVARRGEIYMMDGEEPSIAVMNETVYTIIVDPQICNEEKVKEILEENVSENISAKWEDVFADKTRRYYVVAKNVSLTDAKKIQEADLVGVSFQENTKRVYPEGELASGVLGFVNNDGKGQYGVEGALNRRLSGTNGVLKTIKDVNNVALSIGNNNVKVPAVDGDNIVLTIDKNVQYAAEQALLNALNKKPGATNAGAIVMNPNNGKIWAVANLPNYNAEKYWNVKDMGAYVNHVFEDGIEPASVCKTFTFATGIDLGVMTPQTTYYNSGSMTVDGWPIDNADKKLKLGMITMQDALNNSLNTGSMHALKLMGGDTEKINKQGREKLYEYFHDKFHLGQATGVELHETEGVVTDPNVGDGRNSTYANMTFGQNMQVSMLQVAAGFSSVINGGKYYTPTIVAGVIKDGEFVKNEENKKYEDTVSDATSKTMREMTIITRRAQRSAYDKAGYDIGGKSGTAQAVKNGKYVFDETYATYIGWGAEKGGMPEYVVMVRIWGDGVVTNGTKDALPMFTEISNFMLDYLKLKPAE